MREPLLFLKDAADHLGATGRQVRRWVAERRVPFYKIGNRLRFKPSELDAFIESCARPPLPRDGA